MLYWEDINNESYLHIFPFTECSLSLCFAIFTIFCLLLPTYCFTLLHNYPFQLKPPEIHNACQENVDQDPIQLTSCSLCDHQDKNDEHQCLRLWWHVDCS